MAQPECPGLSSGRFFLYRLPAGEDLSSFIIESCAEKGIHTATFSLSGILSSVTLGIYDSQQQVYVTDTEETPMEILTCTGNISIRNGELYPYATITLADKTGRIIGGRLFSPSRGVAVEITLHELVGQPLQRTYDVSCSLDLWPPHNAKNPSTI